MRFASALFEAGDLRAGLVRGKTILTRATPAVVINPYPAPADCSVARARVDVGKIGFAPYLLHRLVTDLDRRRIGAR